MDSRITEQRRKICIACEQRAECKSRSASLVQQNSTCPLGLHEEYHAALHAITHPREPVSGCCDRVE